jgi:hypothetical protein
MIVKKKRKKKHVCVRACVRLWRARASKIAEESGLRA